MVLARGRGDGDGGPLGMKEEPLDPNDDDDGDPDHILDLSDSFINHQLQPQIDSITSVIDKSLIPFDCILS